MRRYTLTNSEWALAYNRIHGTKLTKVTQAQISKILSQLNRLSCLERLTLESTLCAAIRAGAVK